MEDYAENNGPYIDDEQFFVSIVAAVYGDDYSIASREQIEAGEIGDERIPSNNLLENIPGYPISAVSLLALISVAGLTLKLKRK